MPFQKLLRANSAFFIRLLDTVTISKTEAIILLLIYHTEQIAIFFSSHHNWPQDKISGIFLYAQDISQIVNLRSILDWITIPIDSITFISAVTIFTALVFSSYVYMLYLHLDEDYEITSRLEKYMFSFLLYVSKYSTFILTIPMFQACLLNMGTGSAPHVVLGILSFIFFFSFSIAEKIFFEEDGFLESNYLCKTASYQKIYDCIIFLIVLSSEAFGTGDTYRMIMSGAMTIFFIINAWRVLTWDYFYITQIHKIHLGFIGLKLPISAYLFISSILQLAGIRDVYDIPFGIAVVMGWKIAMNIQHRIEKDLLRDFKTIKTASHADRYMKFLVNTSNLYTKVDSDMFNYSEEELYGNLNATYHFGIFANCYYRDYMDSDSILMAQELYDPSKLKTYFAQPLTDQEFIMKRIPKDVILYKHFIKNLYLYFTKLFPKSDALHLSFASFLLYYLRHSHLVILTCFHLKKLRELSVIDFRTEFSRRRILKTVSKLQDSLDLVRREDNNYTNLDIKGVRDFEEKYISFTEKVNTFVKKYHDFFDQIAQETLSLDSLYQAGNALTVLLENIKSDYKNNLRGSPLATQLYAEFQGFVLMDEIEALEVAKQLEIQLNKIEMYSRLEKDFYEIELMFNKDASIIQIGAHFENLGKIISVNEGCVRLFGYQSKELVLANVNTIMPRLLRVHHDGFLRNYFGTGKETILYREQRSFGLNRDGFVFPLSLLVKPMVNLETSQFMFISYMRSLKTSNEYIITDTNGSIDGISENLAKALGISAELLDSNLLQMQLICPELIPLFEIKPEGGNNFVRMLQKNRASLEPSRSSNRGSLLYSDYKDIRDFNHLIAGAEEINFHVILRNNPQEYCVRLGELLPRNALELFTTLFENARAVKTIESTLTAQLTLAMSNIANTPIEQITQVTGYISQFTSSRGAVRWYIFRFVGLENLNALVQKKKERESKRIQSLDKDLMKKATKAILKSLSKRQGPNSLSNASQSNLEAGSEVQPKSKLEAFVNDLKDPGEEGHILLSAHRLQPPEILVTNTEQEEMSANSGRSASLNSTIIQPLDGMREELRDTILKNGKFKPDAEDSLIAKGEFLNTNQLNKLLYEHKFEAEPEMNQVVKSETSNNESLIAPALVKTENSVLSPRGTTQRDKTFTRRKDGKPASLLAPSSMANTYVPSQNYVFSYSNISNEENLRRKTATLEDMSDSNRGDKFLGGLGEGRKDFIYGIFKEALDKLGNEKFIKKNLKHEIEGTGSHGGSELTWKYDFRALRSAIKTEHIPNHYYQSLGLIYFLFAFVVASFVGFGIACMLTFQNLRATPGLISNTNRIAYKVYKIGSSSFDLYLMYQLMYQGATVPLGTSEFIDGLRRDQSILRTELLYFANNHSFFLDYYGNITEVTEQPIPINFIDITVHLEDYFSSLLLTSIQLPIDYFSELQTTPVASWSVQPIEDIMSTYLAMSDPINNWVDFFGTSESRADSELNAIIIKIVVICVAILVLACLLIWKLLSTTGLIDVTIFQMTYLTHSELMEMKDRIVQAKKIFNDLNLGSELAFHVKGKEKADGWNSKKTKKRIWHMKISSFRWAIPTMLLAIYCISIQILINIVDLEFLKQNSIHTSNLQFLSNEVLTLQRFATEFKNYTLFQKQSDTNQAIYQNIADSFTTEIDQTSSSYQLALSRITEIEPPDTQETFYNIMFLNICNYSTNVTCPSLMSGLLGKGLLTAKIGIIDNMKKQMDSSYTEETLFESFMEITNSTDIIHRVVTSMIETAMDEAHANMSRSIIILVVLVPGVLFLSLVVFRIYWRKSFRKLREEIIQARKVLELIPIPYIIDNSRLKSFVTRTSSLILR